MIETLQAAAGVLVIFAFLLVSHVMLGFASLAR